MSIIKNINEVMHKIRVRLYPNYLPTAEGAYIARTDSDASLNIEQVCAALKNRGGYSGDYEGLVDNVKKYFDEAAYQLADGFAVNTGYYSIHPNIGGTFNSAKDSPDPKKNPLNFKFRINKPLRNLSKLIAIEIAGVADVKAYIDEFVNTEESSVNNLFVPGDIFCIYGSKIKIAGDHPDCGIYFVPVDDPSKAVKVKRIPQNLPSTIMGVAPDTQFQFNRIEIRTQYTGSALLLKLPRTIISGFIIEAA